MKRKLYKYIDGELSEQELKAVEDHIRDCPECASRVESVRKMRSLLRASGEVEASDAYWNTYWDRLEKKLPEQPSSVTLASRISAPLAALFRRPLTLGKIMVYAIFLVFLLYSTPYRSVKVITSQPEFGRVSLPSSVETKPVAGPEAPLLELEAAVKTDQTDAVASLKRDSHALGAGASGGAVAPKGSSFEYRSTATAEAKKGAVDSEAELGDRRRGRSARGVEELALKLLPAKPQEPSGEKLGTRLDTLASSDEYVKADNYFKQGQYVQAIPAYQNFIEANADDQRALKARYQIGESYYQIGNYSEAASNFAVLTEEPKAPAIAKKSAELKEYDRAKAPERKAGGAEPAKEERAEVKQKVAASSETALYYKDQRETVEQLISRAIFRQAESYEQLKKPKEALASYRKYLEKYPKGEYSSKAKEKVAKMSR